MKHMKVGTSTAILCIGIALCACGGKQGNTQTEETAETTPAKPVIIETSQLNPGIQNTEIRTADPANPPVVLDFTTKLPVRPFSLKEHFNKATCGTLKNPLSPDQGSVLYDASIIVSYDRGMSSAGGVNTNVQLLEKRILTSDLFGTFCFDLNGQLTDTLLISRIDELKYDPTTQKLEFHANNRKSTINGITLEPGNQYRYMERDTVNKYNKMVWKSIEDGRLIEEIRFIDSKQTALLTSLDDSTLFNISGDFMSPVMFTTFNKNSYDTLCVFGNYNLPTVKLSGPYAFPESSWSYRNKDKAYFRQAFNDTIFSVSSPNRLYPEYILQFGDKKLNIDNGLYGDKSQKYVAKSWVDTDHFILFTYSKNYDCPNTRNEKSVFYSYALYNKDNKQLSLIQDENNYPEEFLLPAEMPNGIPVILGEISWQDNKLFTSYTKRKLEALQKMKNFSKLPAEQQERVRQLADSLADNEMIVMILE